MAEEEKKEESSESQPDDTSSGSGSFDEQSLYAMPELELNIESDSDSGGDSSVGESELDGAGVESSEVQQLDTSQIVDEDLSPESMSFDYPMNDWLAGPNAELSQQAESSRLEPVPELSVQDEIQDVESPPDRKEDAEKLGRFSYYKRKNIQKGRGGNIPGLEEDGKGDYREAKPGRLDSGKSRDAEGLKRQREISTESMSGSPVGPLAVDLQPDIIPPLSSGASSFVAQGQDTNAMQGSVASASDAVDTFTASLVEVVSRMSATLIRTSELLQSIADKLEVEDSRDEF